jgi:hypothetical protein
MIPTSVLVAAEEPGDQLLLGQVYGAVENRRAISTLQCDPVMVRLLDRYEPSRRLWSRLFSVLLGDDLDVHGRVRAAVISAAIGAAAHSFVADLDNDTLSAELLQVTRRLIFARG